MHDSDAQHSEPVAFATAKGETVHGVLARPAGDGRAPALILVHEAFGLNDDMRRLAERFAGHGFLTLAIDLYGGKTAADLPAAMALVQAMQTAHSIDIMAGAQALLAGHERSNGRVGITGFCLGGGMSLAAACNVDGLAAAVPFYGLPLPQYQSWERARVPPIQGHFASGDPYIQRQRVEAAFEAARAAGVTCELFFYDGPHGFMREGDPQHFHPESAALAWQRTLAFLRQHLG